MRPARPALIALACLSAAGVAAAPAQAGIFGSKKKVEAQVVAPPPPVAPPVAALPGTVLQAAGAYRIYMRKAAAVGAPQAAAEVERSLELAETAEPVGLTKGAVAYAAVTALQEPTFVQGVRVYATDPGQRRTIADRIAADPAYAAVLPGADAAAARISQALAADGMRVADAGKLVKQSAYDMQHQSWSKDAIPDRAGRLAHAKTLAATPMSATQEEIAGLAATDAAAAPGPTPPPVTADSLAATTPPAGARMTSTIQHGLAIAALAALGETGDANDATVQTLLNDSAGTFCHNMAKLNLYQCLAVAKPYYEDAFCLGQHVLVDTGQCVMAMAGLPVAVPARATEAAPEPKLVGPGKAKAKRKH